MKRLRDEAYMNPQLKRPHTSSSSSRGELYGSSHAPAGSGGRVSGDEAGASGNINGGNTGVGATSGAVAAGSTHKLTTNDALSYLKQVKDMFQDQRNKYDRFLDVMKDFKAQRIDTTGVIGRVKELFNGHPNLILGFNTFLPKGYEITLTDGEGAPPKRTVEFEEAISFVNRIKKRFQNDDRVYKSFLDILNMYREEHKSITEVFQEVATLFNDHQDLLDEFTRFLPDASATATASAPHVSIGRHPFHAIDGGSSALPASRQSQIDKQQLRKDRIIEPNGKRDFNIEQTDMDGDKKVTKLHKEHKKDSDRENQDRRISDKDDIDPENNGGIGMRRPCEKRNSAQKAEDWGGTSNMATCDDNNVLKSMCSYEFSFCEKVKERLQSADDYQAFLKCLHIYSTEIITRTELQSLVADLLGKYPDLMKDFNDFLERCERIDGFLAGVVGKKKIGNEGNLSKGVRKDEKEKESKHEVEGAKEKNRHNLKYWGKSIHEIDLSTWQRCTPSYRLLPDDYPVSLASQRSDVGAQVLNDKWVSVTSGSEDYSFKHMRRNQYEESLFRCEDDRFELDMLLESVSSAAKGTEELLNNISSNSRDSDSSVMIERHLSALNLRFIERLYGDHGLDVVDILRKNPTRALRIILMRLKQKHEEWTKCRSDFNKVWADVYSRNHYKSLDHRSFYFKQQDSKNLSTKSLVAEIKAIKEKRQEEDDEFCSIASGSGFSVIPNFKFEYADTEVHEDVFKIVKYSCEEIVSTNDQLNTLLRFWTTFFEPMLGLYSRTNDLKNSEDVSASKCRTMANTSASMTESKNTLNGDAAITNFKQAKANCDVDPSQQLIISNNDFMNVDALTKEFAMTSVEGERLTTSDIPVSSSQDDYHGHVTNSSQVCNSMIEDGHVAKPNGKDLLSLEGNGETSTSNQLTNDKFQGGSRVSEYNVDSADPYKNEKEEGELSPNGDYEDNIDAYQATSFQPLPENTRNERLEENQMESCKEVCVDPAGENDADIDDDSDNSSEGRKDVSGSESAANECLQEEEAAEEGEEEDNLDGKALIEAEAEITSEGHYNGGDGVSVPQSAKFSMTCKPLSKHVVSPFLGDEKKDLRVFYGSDSFYVLFRLHQMLYERILSAKENIVSGEAKQGTTKDDSSDSYSRFMSALFSLLDGSSDNSKFEDDCRSLIGNQSYVLFTLDKLIYKLIKQLQTVSTDEMDCRLIQLYEYEKSRKAEKYIDSVYYDNIHVLLHDENENIYRFEYTSNPTCLAIRLMDNGKEKSEVAASVDPNFSAYLNNDYLSVAHGMEESSGVMLKRF
ncbi:paired amphipathic helix protein Sin3-like 2 isoform X2 [Andrographis paniculata]|uniref:paired amphipathic helix protein Sin3-like 2 isoform X2 n=1 Tax=Andrographis paniculata TaxID=175694 RepID=UPI0021E8AE66|nr:paired amphipathic helix protein Sin3-like 2 isoform X2 [Andrographis paniculata]